MKDELLEKEIRILAKKVTQEQIDNILESGYGKKIIEILKLNPEFDMSFTKEQLNLFFSFRSKIKFGQKYLAELNYFITDEVIEILELYAKDISDIKKLDKKEVKKLLIKFYNKEIDKLEFVTQLKELMINNIYMESSKLGKEEVLKRMENESIVYFEINNQLLVHKEIALALLKRYKLYAIGLEKYTYFYKLLPHSLQEDEDILLESYYQNLNILTKRENILKIYEKKGDFSVYEILSEELRKDKQLAIAYLQKYAKKHYDCDEGIFSSFVKYFPNELLDDDEFVYELVKERADNFSFASDRLKNDKEFIEKIINLKGRLIKRNVSIGDNRRWSRECILLGYTVENYISDELKNDLVFMGRLEKIKETDKYYNYINQLVEIIKEVPENKVFTSNLDLLTKIDFSSDDKFETGVRDDGRAYLIGEPGGIEYIWNNAIKSLKKEGIFLEYESMDEVGPFKIKKNNRE